MDREQFLESLLEVMERKKHWAWPLFTSGKVAKERLHIHLEQEYAVYIRDFAVLLGRVYAQCPIGEVRRALVENMLEEETGLHSGGRPHADMFLDYPRGLGMDVTRFDQVVLLPDAARYRAALDEATQESGWEVGAAVTTIFLEGTEYERGELDPNAPRRPEPPLDHHPLVVHYGLPLASLQLARAHRLVEKDHRKAAWAIVLEHVAPARRDAVVTGMQRVLAAWLAYRDDVAAACGVVRA